MEESHVLKKILRGQFRERRLVMKARKNGKTVYSIVQLDLSEVNSTGGWK
jgi:hypothetical protein